MVAGKDSPSSLSARRSDPVGDEEANRRIKETLEHAAERRQRLDEAHHDIRLALEEALVAHRCDGWDDCWCHRGWAAISRLRKA
jgi:hypothetical protein